MTDTAAPGAVDPILANYRATQAAHQREREREAAAKFFGYPTVTAYLDKIAEVRHAAIDETRYQAELTIHNAAELSRRLDTARESEFVRRAAHDAGIPPDQALRHFANTARRHPKPGHAGLITPTNTILRP